MLMEEPENGLTPAAIEHFYSAVHSPFVMCEAWNGEEAS
jgi:hypothetical protein